MKRSTYRPIRLTQKQKDSAMAFYSPNQMKAADKAEQDWMRSPEGQAAITNDSIRALELADKAKYAKREAQQERRAFLSDPDFQQDWARDDQRQLTSDLSKFVLGGNATFTVVSKKTGTRFTFRVRSAKGDGDNLPHFVSVLTGSDNEHNFTYLGTIFKDNTYRHGRKSSISQTAPSAAAFQWLWLNIDDPALTDKIEFWHEGRCCRCGRKLTVPSSIEAGIGPECAGKE